MTKKFRLYTQCGRINCRLETLQLFIFLLVVLWDFWKSFLAKFSCSVVLCFTILASGHVNLAIPQPSKLVCFKKSSQTVKFKVLQKYRHCYRRDPPCIALFLTWTVYVRRSRSRCFQIILTAGARYHHMSVKVTLSLRGDVKLPGSLNTLVDCPALINRVSSEILFQEQTTSPRADREMKLKKIQESIPVRCVPLLAKCTSFGGHH